MSYTSAINVYKVGNFVNGKPIKGELNIAAKQIVAGLKIQDSLPLEAEKAVQVSRALVKIAIINPRTFLGKTKTADTITEILAKAAVLKRSTHMIVKKNFKSGRVRTSLVSKSELSFNSIMLSIAKWTLRLSGLLILASIIKNIWEMREAFEEIAGNFTLWGRAAVDIAIFYLSEKVIRPVQREIKYILSQLN